MKRWIAAGFLFAVALNLGAQAPEMFRYQGRLASGTNLVNATLPMSFKLYDALSGGVLLYEDSSSVPVVDGLYSTTIGDDTVFGSLTNAMTNAAVYLELTVNGEVMSPRERLVSVPYALNLPAPAFHIHESIIGLSGLLDFGTVGIGMTKTNVLTIYNFGIGTMTVTGIQYPNGCYSGNWSGTLQTGGSTNITVTFAPTTARNYSGTIKVHGDQSSGNNVIACTGTGGRYVDNGDGTVTDSATNLMWTKNANHGAMTWVDAMAYCDNLVTNGYDDWRLPAVAQSGGTSAELDTLFRKEGNPFEAWEVTEGYPFFDGVQNSNYWSSMLSPYGLPTQPWYVRMNSGTVVYSSRSNSFFVWPVRGGQ